MANSYRELSPREMARFVRLLRRLLEIHHRKTFNVLEVFEKAKLIFPRLKMRIVPDSDLSTTEARAYPEEWLIKIRQGVYDGLRKGDRSARWTFVHELGHVILQHPGRPFRSRTPLGDQTLEQQAHGFAAEFLAHTEKIAVNSSIEGIADAFQLSLEAARRRKAEIDQLQLSRKHATRLFKAGDRNDDISSEEFAAAAHKAIIQTISIDSHLVSFIPQAVATNTFSAAVTIGRAANLLCDSYESVRKTSPNEIRAASLIIATTSVRPIRRTPFGSSDSPGASLLNWRCGFRAALVSLGRDAHDLSAANCFEAENERREFVGDYLADFASQALELIKSPSTLLQLDDLPDYFHYNEHHEISWLEIHQLETLAKLFSPPETGLPHKA